MLVLFVLILLLPPAGASSMILRSILCSILFSILRIILCSILRSILRSILCGILHSISEARGARFL